MRKCSCKKIGLAAIIVFAYACVSFLLKHNNSDVWRVVGVVPPSIIRDTIDTPTYYIIKQTHEPFLRSDDLQNYTSKVLRDWQRSVDYKTFVFHPDTSLKFNNEKRLTKSLFDELISSATVNYGVPFHITSTSDAVKVEFQTPQKKYLYFLTWYENAPGIKHENFEYGLGEFYISSYTAQAILFERKRRVRNGYNRIEYFNYIGDKDPRLQDRRVQDFNLLSKEQRPKWINAEYTAVSNPAPGSAVLLINHPDKVVRMQLYNCIDVREFRNAFFGDTQDFYNIMTILPAGIPGAQSGLPQQNCSRKRGIAGKEFGLINLRVDNKEMLSKYLKTLHKQTGVIVKEIKMEYGAIVKVINNRDRRPYTYNLLVIYLDTLRPDYKVFFEYTAGYKSFLDLRLASIEDLFRQLLKAEDFFSQKEIAEKLAEKLGNEGLVLPLYQTSSTIFYPKNIRNIILGTGFRQYPEVADFRW